MVYRKSFLSILVIVSSLAGASCDEAVPAKMQTEVRIKSGCVPGNLGADEHIKAKIQRLRDVKDLDDGETLSIALGRSYETHPCEFIKQAIDAGLSDKQVASLISALPIELVDMPCESKERLQGRQDSLAGITFDADRVLAIKDIVQESLDRDARMCIAK